jgi:hypothetical protein
MQLVRMLVDQAMLCNACMTCRADLTAGNYGKLPPSIAWFETPGMCPQIGTAGGNRKASMPTAVTCPAECTQYHVIHAFPTSCHHAAAFTSGLVHNHNYTDQELQEHHCMWSALFAPSQQVSQVGGQ